MNKNIYKIIAQKNGVSIKSVKKEIEKAIKFAYQDPNLYAQSVPRKIRYLLLMKLLLLV